MSEPRRHGFRWLFVAIGFHCCLLARAHSNRSVDESWHDAAANSVPDPQPSPNLNIPRRMAEVDRSARLRRTHVSRRRIFLPRAQPRFKQDATPTSQLSRLPHQP
jgi:hypothetical protein